MRVKRAAPGAARKSSGEMTMAATTGTTKRATKRTTKPGAPGAAAKRRQLRAHAEARIDEFLRSVGVKDPSEWTDDEGARRLFYGDVEGFAQVEFTDGVVTLTVAAQVMPLPSDQELIVPLMRELLESNPVFWGAPRFAIAGDLVWLGARHPVEELEDDDYGSEITRVMSLADDVAPDLKKRYGGTTRKRK
jgi:hypothetical protein